MYIYNVTINLEEDIQQDWLHWMREEHIPDMLSTGKFYQARIVRVMVEEEMGGVTYSVQYLTDSYDKIQQYYREDADRLRGESQKRFAGKFVAFRTELEVISDHE